MKKIILMLLVVTALVSCSKDVVEPDLSHDRLVEVNSYYQTYSFGNLNSTKHDWETYRYDDNGRISYSKTYSTYQYDRSTLLPKQNRYSYNEDGTIKEVDEDNITSRYKYRFEYNADKLPVKKETWRPEGLWATETYSYDNGKKVETVSESIIVHSYNSKGELIFDEYFKNEKREPWFRYEYLYDDFGGLLQKKQINFDRVSNVIINQYEYEYDEMKRITVKTDRRILEDWRITYEYNDDDLLLSESVERERNGSFEKFMFITYEYTYK